MCLHPGTVENMNSFALTCEPTEGKTEIIYVGSDRAKAFDAFMEWTKTVGYAEVSYLKIVEEK